MEDQMTIPDLEKIRRLESQLAEEKKKLNEWNARPNDDYKLAELMHSMYCRHDHTERCGWYYENGSSHPARKDPWSLGADHKRWLEIARNFKTTAVEIQKVAKAKKGYELYEALIKHLPRYF